MNISPVIVLTFIEAERMNTPCMSKGERDIFGPHEAKQKAFMELIERHRLGQTFEVLRQPISDSPGREVLLERTSSLLCGLSEDVSEVLRYVWLCFIACWGTYKTAGIVRYSTIRRTWNRIGTRLVFTRQQR